MVKYSLFGAFILTFMVFIFGCQEEPQEDQIIKPSDMYCNYVLFEVQADREIDLNFDGEANIDLTKEIETFRDCYVFFARQGHYLSIAWLEPETDRNVFLIQAIPTVYDEIMKIIYRLIGINYYYSLNNERTQLIPEGITLDQAKNYYTFVCPHVLDIDKQKDIISFQTTQSFLVKEGLVTRTLTAKFKPGTPEDVFK